MCTHIAVYIHNKYVYKDVYTRKCIAALLITMEMESTHLSKKEYLSEL